MLQPSISTHKSGQNIASTYVIEMYGLTDQQRIYPKHESANTDITRHFLLPLSATVMAHILQDAQSFTMILLARRFRSNQCAIRFSISSSIVWRDVVSTLGTTLAEVARYLSDSRTAPFFWGIIAIACTRRTPPRRQTLHSPPK